MFEFKMGDVIAEIGGRHKFFVFSGVSDSNRDYYNMTVPESPPGYGDWTQVFIHGDKSYIESHYVKVGEFEDYKEINEDGDGDEH